VWVGVAYLGFHNRLGWGLLGKVRVVECLLPVVLLLHRWDIIHHGRLLHEIRRRCSSILLLAHHHLRWRIHILIIIHLLLSHDNLLFLLIHLLLSIDYNLSIGVSEGSPSTALAKWIVLNLFLQLFLIPPHPVFFLSPLLILLLFYLVLNLHQILFLGFGTVLKDLRWLRWLLIIAWWEAARLVRVVLLRWHHLRGLLERGLLLECRVAWQRIVATHIRQLGLALLVVH